MLFNADQMVSWGVIYEPRMMGVCLFLERHADYHRGDGRLSLQQQSHGLSFLSPPALALGFHLACESLPATGRGDASPCLGGAREKVCVDSLQRLLFSVSRPAQ